MISLRASSLIFSWVLLVGILIDASDLRAATKSEIAKPNIVVILADDLGYGDVHPNNPSSGIPTPNFDRLAEEGINFTDAHSGSGVCTPTRYGLLCGRYCWRTDLKRGVLGGYSKPLIQTDRQTIGHVMQRAGYHTGCVGKWHLGLGWQWKKPVPDNINNFGIAGQNDSVDYSQPIGDGPLQHGFDTCYIIPASLDMSPYVYIQNDRVTAQPDRIIDAVRFPKFFRKGEIAPDFSHVQCLDHLAEQACQYIGYRSRTGKPFFLYFPMPAPHKPVIPTEKFDGSTELGAYGDFVHQVDATVGKILKTLDETGKADQTLVIVTSDNGSFMYRFDDGEKPDHLIDPTVQGYQSNHHTANGPLRGTKADIYEAGHRVPFFCRWPDIIPAGTRSVKTICLTDILATAAEAADVEFDAKSACDSFSFLKSATTGGRTNQDRPLVINHSSGGMFAVRDQHWKLILGNGSGGRQQPKGTPFEQPYQLYDLRSDLAEQTNLIGKHPDIASTLAREFEQLADGDHLATSRQ